MAAIRTGLPGNFSGAAVSRPVGLTELSNIIYAADPDLATMTKLYFRHIDGVRASERRSQNRTPQFHNACQHAGHCCGSRYPLGKLRAAEKTGIKYKVSDRQNQNNSKECVDEPLKHEQCMDSTAFLSGFSSEP
jgi:hypothetical protein